MFEKEAEEYAYNQIGCGDGYYEWTDVTQAYQKGAEFGYNKAKEEMQEIGLALQSDMDKTIEQNIQLKKHNENLIALINAERERQEKCDDVHLQKIAELEKELKAEKEFNATLRKEIDEYTNSHTLCAKYKQLEKKISVLLSCKNCPENKGGYICQKEYEDKCLSQKIQYIKELQEENEELKAENEELKKGLGCKTCQIHLEYMNRIVDLKKENAELQQKWLDESYEKAKCIKSLDDKNKEINYLSEQIQKLKIELDTPESVVLDKLDEAKEIIKLLLGDLRNRSYEPVKDLEQTEQFLKEVEK